MKLILPLLLRPGCHRKNCPYHPQALDQASPANSQTSLADPLFSVSDTPDQQLSACELPAPASPDCSSADHRLSRPAPAAANLTLIQAPNPGGLFLPATTIPGLQYPLAALTFVPAHKPAKYRITLDFSCNVMALDGDALLTFQIYTDHADPLLMLPITPAWTYSLSAGASTAGTISGRAVIKEGLTDTDCHFVLCATTGNALLSERIFILNTVFTAICLNLTNQE